MRGAACIRARTHTHTHTVAVLIKNKKKKPPQIQNESSTAGLVRSWGRGGRGRGALVQPDLPYLAAALRHIVVHDECGDSDRPLCNVIPSNWCIESSLPLALAPLHVPHVPLPRQSSRTHSGGTALSGTTHSGTAHSGSHS
ncbi:hypothetical protein XELAEV_18005251mg [Xenopus laevis]|uniref:Uncharacterized protein n=1 Tax=Xenopus laevis TaxID=8355 RepID=A0A974I2Y2_XENLA|nr:hypothetical protein XELAEV_18005251mg [Xenopus laevis]